MYPFEGIQVIYDQLDLGSVWSVNEYAYSVIWMVDLWLEMKLGDKTLVYTDEASLGRVEPLISAQKLCFFFAYGGIWLCTLPSFFTIGASSSIN